SMASLRITRSCFFFQAEDGIRYRTVTGVQTCALPILSGGDRVARAVELRHRGVQLERMGARGDRRRADGAHLVLPQPLPLRVEQIGRASCRERVKISVGGAS